MVSLSSLITELKTNLLGCNKGVLIDGDLQYIVFLSFGNPEARAYVCKGIGQTPEQSWEKAVAELGKKIKKTYLKPVWLKADVVTAVKEFSLPAFIQHISHIKINYFREGIAFDKRFKIAFLEQEVNANVFIHKLKEQDAKTLVWGNINHYLKLNTGMNLLLGPDVVDKVFTFSTVSVFYDGIDCYRLGSEWSNNGRRLVPTVDQDYLRLVVERASEYLSSQVYPNGQFRYGYFPCFNKEIPHYNILRHASTTYSIIEAYEITNSTVLKDAITRALHYLVQEGVKTVRTPQGIDAGFVVERSDGDAIKLGANAAAILALAKYTQVFSDDRFLPVLNQLAAGIAYMQSAEGGFNHVLNYPDLSVREAHRIIYYDGEAVFALMRLYALTKEDRWLQIVEQAFAFFIQNRYWHHNDHWLSYCSYELFLYRPDEKYLEFNLKNAEGILDFCLTRETTYATLLELLMACSKTIKLARRDNLYPQLIAAFDENKLKDAIRHRAEHQLNGLMFPEVAMYFKVPKNILWGFYIRHHSFRVRIDDVEHNLSGYCSYYHSIGEERAVAAVS